MSVLKLENVSKSFKRFKAVDDMSFSLDEGKIYGFIGPNGAGKSTTINMIAGLLKATSGTITILNEDVSNKNIRKYLGFSSEFPVFYNDMGCLDFLIYMGTLCGMSYKEAYKEALYLIDRLALGGFENKKVSSFSTGMKKKVGLAAAIIHHPKLILLDEPTANLDPDSRLEIIEIIKELASDNKTILISSHVLSELETFIDNVLIIQKGKLVLDASMEEVQRTSDNATLIINSKDQRLKAFLDHKAYIYALNDGVYRVKVDNDAKSSIKKYIVENDIDFKELYDENMSLNDLYESITKGERHETDHS